jgi:hypothetical protein
LRKDKNLKKCDEIEVQTLKLLRCICQNRTLDYGESLTGLEEALEKYKKGAVVEADTLRHLETVAMPLERLYLV